MLPLAVAVAWTVVDCVPVAVPVKVIVVIDVDVAAAPVAIAPPVIRDARADKDTSAKGQPHSRIIAGIAVRIVGIRRRTINDCWIVGGNINGLRISLLNNNNVLVVGRFGLDYLFLAGLQRAFGLCFRPHPLHGIHYILLLGEKGVPQISRPLDIGSQSPDHIRDCGHRLDARIPWLLPDCVGQGLAFQAFVLIHPLL